MTDAEYQKIMRDIEVGRKQINFQMAGAKNLFLRVSPQLFKERTGCSVGLSCFVTRAVVYFLDPFFVIASGVAGCFWLGLPGILLLIPSLILWGLTKSYFGMRLPSGWTVLFMSVGISLIGSVYFHASAATIYFVCLGVLIFQNYLLYAVPLADAIKCVPRSKVAFEIFYETSKHTLLPVLTVLDVQEYVDEETRNRITKN